jgi:hypothetical protein
MKSQESLPYTTKNKWPHTNSLLYYDGIRFGIVESSDESGWEAERPLVSTEDTPWTTSSSPSWPR